MFKWAMPAAGIALLAIGLQPAAGEARQKIKTTFAIPSQTLTFATHYVAHDAGIFQNEGLKVIDGYLAGAVTPNAMLAGRGEVPCRRAGTTRRHEDGGAASAIAL